MSVIGEHLSENFIIVVKVEFVVFHDDRFAEIEIDGRLMLTSARRKMFLPSVWIYTIRSGIFIGLPSAVLVHSKLTFIVPVGCLRY